MPISVWCVCFGFHNYHILWSTNHYCSVTIVHCTCSSRYSHDRERSAEAANNMKKVLGHLKNLPLNKNIAQQSGMNDLLQSLSTTYNEGFLNDIARLWLWLSTVANNSVWLNFNRYDVNNNNVIGVRCVSIIMQTNCMKHDYNNDHKKYNTLILVMVSDWAVGTF